MVEPILVLRQLPSVKMRFVAGKVALSTQNLGRLSTTLPGVNGFTEPISTFALISVCGMLIRTLDLILGGGKNEPVSG
jgi:hypothetical protein